TLTSESSPANPGRKTFTGLTFLRNAGLLQANQRIYDAPTGRWIQQDPKRFGAGDSKLDRYVHNNPVNGIDPSGLVPIIQGISVQVLLGQKQAPTPEDMVKQFLETSGA